MSGVNEYSLVPASNTAIAGVNIAEQCPPSGINNAIRQQMADLRAALNDIGAKQVSTGTDTITLTTETGYTAYADGTLLCFIAGGTNTGATTLNVDAVGAKKVLNGTAELAAGEITLGNPVAVVFDASADAAAGAWLVLNARPDLSDFITEAEANAAFQPIDADLTAVAALASTGIAVRTAANTWAQRTITGTANQVTVTNGSGAAGNPTISAHIATQAEAQAGSDNVSLMTPLRTAQAITSQVSAAQIVTGSYTGDGTTSMAVTGLGITPKYVRIWVRITSPDDAVPGVFETTAQILDDTAGQGSIQTNASPNTFRTSRIIALGSGSFTVDDASANEHPNASGVVYNFIAIG